MYIDYPSAFRFNFYKVSKFWATAVALFLFLIFLINSLYCGSLFFRVWHFLKCSGYGSRRWPFFRIDFCGSFLICNLSQDYLGFHNTISYRGHYGGPFFLCENCSLIWFLEWDLYFYFVIFQIFWISWHLQKNIYI